MMSGRSSAYCGGTGGQENSLVCFLPARVQPAFEGGFSNTDAEFAELAASTGYILCRADFFRRISSDRILSRCIPHNRYITFRQEYEFDAYPPPVFYDTQEVGIYRITHQAEEQEYEGSFIVSVPTDDISDLRTAGEVPEGRGEAAEAKTSPFERNIWMAAGWILLLLLLTEWWVYHHGA